MPINEHGEEFYRNLWANTIRNAYGTGQNVRDSSTERTLFFNTFPGATETDWDNRPRIIFDNSGEIDTTNWDSIFGEESRDVSSRGSDSIFSAMEWTGISDPTSTLTDLLETPATEGGFDTTPTFTGMPHYGSLAPRVDVGERSFIDDDLDLEGMPDNVRRYFDAQDDEARRWLSRIWRDSRAYEAKFNNINELKAWAASMGYPQEPGSELTDSTEQPTVRLFGSTDMGRDGVLEGIADGSIRPSDVTPEQYEKLGITPEDLNAIQEGYGENATQPTDDDVPETGPDRDKDGIPDADDLWPDNPNNDGPVDTETEPLTPEEETRKRYILEGIRLGRIQPEDLDWQEGGELSELGIGKEELNEIVTKGLENGSIDLESLSEEDLELLDIDIPTGFRKLASDAVKGIKDIFRGIFGGVIDTIKDPLGTAEEVFQGAMGTSIGIKYDCEDKGRTGLCTTKLVVKIGVPIPGLTGEGLEIDLVRDGEFVFDDNAKAKVNEVFDKLGDKVDEVQDKIADAIDKLSKKTKKAGGTVTSATQDKDGNIIVKIIDAAGKAVKKILTPVEMIGELFGVPKGSSATGIGRGLGKILTVWGLGEILKKGKSGGSGSGTGTTPGTTTPGTTTPGTTTPGTGGSPKYTYTEEIFRAGRLNNLGNVLTSTYPGLLDLDDEQRQDILDEIGNNLDEWDALPDQEKKKYIDGLIDDSTVYPDNLLDNLPDDLSDLNDLSDAEREALNRRLNEGDDRDRLFGTETGTDYRDDNALVSGGGAAEALVSGGANNPFFSLLGDPESGGIFGEDETGIGDLEYFYNWASIFANPEQAKMYASARPTITNLLLDRLEKSQNNLNEIKRESNMLREPLTGININRGVV